MTKILNPRTGKPLLQPTVNLFTPSDDITAAEIAQVLAAFFGSQQIAFTTIAMFPEDVQRHFTELNQDGTPVSAAH